MSLVDKVLIVCWLQKHFIYNFVFVFLFFIISNKLTNRRKAGDRVTSHV